MFRAHTHFVCFEPQFLVALGLLFDWMLSTVTVMVCCLAYVVVDPCLQSQILLLHLFNSMHVTSYNHDCKQVHDFGQFIHLVGVQAWIGTRTDFHVLHVFCSSNLRPKH